MIDDTNGQNVLSVTNITDDSLAAPHRIETIFEPFKTAKMTGIFATALRQPVFKPPRHTRTFQISSDYFRKVTETTDIAGRLPNAVFTLPPHLVQAIVGLADVTDATRMALVFECKKFYLANSEYEKSKVVSIDDETRIFLFANRLYSEGNNTLGQCGIGSNKAIVTGPRLIRLPPVQQVWCGRWTWFAKTTSGLYAWGSTFKSADEEGRFDGVTIDGKPSPGNFPRWISIGDVDNVVTGYCVAFIKPMGAAGWMGVGDNSFQQLGINDIPDTTVATAIPNSEAVTRWASNNVTFAWTPQSLLACGDNLCGQCGVGSTADTVTTFTPVALPYDVRGRVDRVVTKDCSIFCLSGRRCFSFGENRHGQLGEGSNSNVNHPTELPVPVDDIVTILLLTIIRSGNTLLACGDNEDHRIAPIDTPNFNTPIAIDLPAPVVRLAIGGSNIFVQLTDKSWVGRGLYDESVFIPVPEANLIDGRFIDGWVQVSSEHVDTLQSLDSAQLMDLPEPVANHPVEVAGLMNAIRMFKEARYPVQQWFVY